MLANIEESSGYRGVQMQSDSVQNSEVVVGWGAEVVMSHYLSITLPFIPALAALLYFLGGPSRAPLWVLAIGSSAVTALLIFLAWAEAIQVPREIRISADGLVLVYGWPNNYEMRGAWANWKPMAGSRVMWWVSLEYLSGRIWYPITPVQARAIFSHPSCPQWKLPKGVQRAAGWPTTTAGNMTVG